MKYGGEIILPAKVNWIIHKIGCTLMTQSNIEWNFALSKCILFHLMEAD
jgi:hypothetical protein